MNFPIHIEWGSGVFSFRGVFSFCKMCVRDKGLTKHHVDHVYHKYNHIFNKLVEVHEEGTSPLTFHLGVSPFFLRVIQTMAIGSSGAGGIGGDSI